MKAVRFQIHDGERFIIFLKPLINHQSCVILSVNVNAILALKNYPSFLEVRMLESFHDTVLEHCNDSALFFKVLAFV